jgi:hypothetical protein
MDIRRNKRLIVSLSAEIRHEGKTYRGFIGNLSEEGIYMRVAPPDKFVIFDPGAEVELMFQVPSGGTVKLLCRVAWSDRILPNSIIQNLGMKVIEVSEEYREFLSGRIEF